MRTGRSSAGRKASTALITAAAALGAAVSAMYPAMCTQAAEVCSYRVEREINMIVAEELERCTDESDGSCIETYLRTDGSAGMIAADASGISALENRLRRAVNSRLSELENDVIKVHIGTLTGSAALNEKGPELGITMQREGAAETSLEGEFTSAGINQTRYTLKLHIRVDMLVQLPAHSETVSAECERVVCEAVIVGDVPERYNDTCETDETDAL